MTRLLLPLLLAALVCVRCATVEYHMMIRRGSWRVDSKSRNATVVLVNEQFPAPTLDATVGDDVLVHVQNDLTEGTALHFHGLLQRGTPHMDGVPYGTQCPIAPGANFTYSFKADAVGTFWYHAHVESHFVEGLYGGFVVRASPSEPKVDELLLILSDWYRSSADEIMRKMASPPFATPLPDAVLVNGLGGENMAELRLRANTTYRVRVINAAAISLFRLTIEMHNVSVVEADADRVQPFSTSFLEIDAGQRYVFQLTTDGANGTFALSVQMLHRAEPTPLGHAMVMVGEAASMLRRKRQVHGGGHVATPVGTAPADEAFFERLLSADSVVTLPAVTKRINITTQFSSATGQWRINDVAMPRSAMTPVLHSVLRGDRLPASVQTITLNEGDVVEITWHNKRDANGQSEHHPMHIHGHRFWLLGSGTTGDPFQNIPDATRPLLRDTFDLPHEDGWAITRFVADNPGVWMVHCHYSWHMASGMAFFFVYAPSSSLPSLPTGTQQCDIALSSETPSSTSSAVHLHPCAFVLFSLVFTLLP